MFRLGIVGAGAIGISHKNAILKNPDCEIVAICDLAEEKAVQLAEGTDARTYTDYRVMAAAETLDGVILNLPHFLHKDVTIFFLEKGVPVLIEKPMANTAEECDAMIAASEKTGTPLAVGHVQRYYPCYNVLKEMIEKETLGKLCSITEVRNLSYFENRPRWFLTKNQAGGGILMNYGAHTLDKIFYVTGKPIVRLCAAGNNFLTEDDVEASAQLLFTLEGGVSASCTYCGCKVPMFYETNFYFTNGMAQVRGGQELWLSEGNQPLERADIDYGDKNVFDCQLIELVKLLKGEENHIATPAYSKEVIVALEQAFSQI